MVRTLLGLPEIPRPDDAADGLAIAICHAFSARMDRTRTERAAKVGATPGSKKGGTDS